MAAEITDSFGCHHMLVINSTCLMPGIVVWAFRQHVPLRKYTVRQSLAQPYLPQLALTKLWTSKTLGVSGKAVAPKQYLNACEQTPTKYLRA